jgi:hypothetical protein
MNVTAITALVISIIFISINPKADAASYRPTYSYRPVTLRTITPTYQYRQINAYVRPSTGTYVNSYYRGVQNNVRYDNLNYYYQGLNGRRIYPNR